MPAVSTLFKGLERIEEARERFVGPSFMAGVYEGRPHFELLCLPPEPPEEKEAGDAYLKEIETFLTREVDPDEIERTAKIPESVFKGLFALGTFAMKIPKEYGGLGFSYTNYGRVLTLMASWSNILALTVAVPQSIGIGMPILLFGTEEQKKKYLPLVAREAISAFALTEPMTGSDAANIQTEAVMDATGDHFRVKGEKLWCTNGPIARYLTLIARVPARRVQQDGKPVWRPTPEGKDAEDLVHSAFILDMRTPGVQVRQRCQFEGCRGIENAHITLNDVRVPAENVIGQIGQGLKYALTILNVGRAISIPAICLGMAKQAWQPTLDRASTRLTFGQPLATRQTQQVRIGRMAADLYAMDALAHLVWRLADQHRHDIRIEAAIAKLFCSEQAIRFVRDAQIIFGGMGYETADSKRVRGEPAFGIEQLVRDVEMYRIGEGATDVLRPFVAREGLNLHFDRTKKLFSGELSSVNLAAEWLMLLRFYGCWYAGQWLQRPLPHRAECRHPRVRPAFRYVERTSRRLARSVFYAMVVYRERLRDDQGRQHRIEAVGEDLLAMAAAVLKAESDERLGGRSEAWELADEFFSGARDRIARNIWELLHNRDAPSAATGQRAASGRYSFLSEGGIRRGLFDYLSKKGS